MRVTRLERALYYGLKKEIYGPGMMKVTPRTRRWYWKAYKVLERRHEIHMANVVANLVIGEDVTNKGIDVKVPGGPPSGYVNEEGYDDFAYSGYTEDPPRNDTFIGTVEISEQEWKGLKNVR